MRKGLVALGLAAAALVMLAVGPARAVQEELLDQARQLVKEAQPLVEKANDMDLDMEARKGPRKEAFARLKKARDLYNTYLDANPSMEDKIDKEYVDLVAMLYWIKKDSSLGELEKDGPPADLPQSGDAPPNAPRPPDWKDKPTPGQPAPPPGTAPAGPAAVDPQRAKRQFDAIADFQKKNPGDLPKLLDFYQRFLGDYPDTSLPEYAQAVERIGKINDRMKGVLKDVGKRDPDSISGGDTKAESAIFGRLSQDLNSKDPDVRRRAAKLMADSRARAATFFLARGMADKDDEFARICREGLVAIGGTFVGENLVKLYRDASKEKQQAAMEILKAITLKGPIDAAAESEHIGHFVLSNESDVAEAAIDLLTQMGKAGGRGLMHGLDSKNNAKKIAAMQALAQVKYYRAAAVIGDRYLGTKVPRDIHDAAMDSLDKMGVYAVPYLIKCLSNAYTPVVLRKLTGDPTIILGDEKKVRAWWNANKPKDAEDD